MFQFSDSLGHRNKILRGIQALKNPLWQHINDDAEDTASMPNELCCPITHEIMRDPVVATGLYSHLIFSFVFIKIFVNLSNRRLFL